MVPADWALVLDESEDEVFAASDDFSADSDFSEDDFFGAAGFSAGFSDSAEEGAEDLAARSPTESFRPGWISDGSEPTTSRLSAYSFFQPPSTSCSSAIFER